MTPSRREFLRVCAAGGGVLLGCGVASGARPGGSARLLSRPGTPTGTLPVGVNRLGLGSGRDGYLQVPAGYVRGRPAPFLLALHGAGGRASGPLKLMGPYAESRGFLLLTVDSADSTWDGIRGRYGTDVEFIDTALHRAFDLVSVDPGRVAVSGFSDGASYALGLGLANGDLFPRVMAFSPGFIPSSGTLPTGHPEFFFSHGRQDPILPIDSASRLIVPGLRRSGYAVTFFEFDGGHTVPAGAAQAGVEWMLR